jgi:indoleamine 2,3-dioxygenase
VNLSVQRNKAGVRRFDAGRILPVFLCYDTVATTSAMSPHKVPALPSPAALPYYGISKNGFLPAESPLTRLPHTYYQPWEKIIEQIPILVETQQIRQWVDELPVLDTSHLSSEAEWQRAHSMLAVIAQGYIWAGPEPSEVCQH